MPGPWPLITNVRPRTAFVGGPFPGVTRALPFVRCPIPPALNPYDWPAPQALFVATGPAPPPVDIRTALVAHLRETALTELVGTRIFPSMVPQRILRPTCVYAVISDPRAYHLLGPAGIPEARIEIKIQSPNFLDCVRGAQILRAIFSPAGGFSGLLGGLVPIRSISLADERDHYDEPSDGSDEGTYAIAQDYIFRYRES